MKKIIFLLILMTESLTCFASISDLECVGDLTRDSFSRRTHLSYNTETRALEGYRGAIELGGIFYSAKDAGDKVRLEIARDLGDRIETIATKDFAMTDSDIRLETKLAEEFEASLFCFTY